ncbi:SHOCT domain-containing protein [Microbacterium caowuchunii]|uniref:SHOCT domain-containing protein n=1 Tax=Microbacterium caowuchunii TaxID=2614638 RepID=UPI001EE8C716|nr:SHOCT domain-containing protein [Microbacterium caowuchunii]
MERTGELGSTSKDGDEESNPIDRAQETHMSPRPFPGWSESERAKKASEAAQYLLPGETVIYQGPAGIRRPPVLDLVVTDMRVFTYLSDRVSTSIDLDAISEAAVVETKRTLAVTDHEGRVLKISGLADQEAPYVRAAVEVARAAERPTAALEAVRRTEDAAAEASRVSAMLMHERWPDTTILGKQTRKGEEAIQRLCHGEEAPWLVMSPGFAQGLLAAFDDRLAIIKTGAMTSWMAGAFLGERSTTFYFTDINAIEYNSGFASGVLEVLTASYQGTANKDYWRGTSSSRNADRNDPYTLSNTLPMAKAIYNEWAPHIQELRARISASKRAPQHAAPSSNVQMPATDLVSQLERLAALRTSEVLTDEEFAVAKARLMSQ